MVLRDDAHFLPLGILEINIKVYDLKGVQFIDENQKIIVLFGSGENPVAKPELQQERLNICSDCPFFNKDLKACMECGCYMPDKVKSAYAECPIGKW